MISPHACFLSQLRRNVFAVQSCILHPTTRIYVILRVLGLSQDFSEPVRPFPGPSAAAGATVGNDAVIGRTLRPRPFNTVGVVALERLLEVQSGVAFHRKGANVVLTKAKHINVGRLENNVRNNERRKVRAFQQCDVGLLCTTPASEEQRLKLANDIRRAVSQWAGVRCVNPSPSLFFISELLRKHNKSVQACLAMVLGRIDATGHMPVDEQNDATRRPQCLRRALSIIFANEGKCAWNRTKWGVRH